jgi:hypothetical protein
MKEEEGFRYEPFKEVIVMECTRFNTPDDLARFASVAAGGKPTGIYWAKGVAFIYFPLPATTDVAVKSVMEERKLYWAFVSYALMPKHSPLIETKEKIIVPVIDMSTSPLFSKAAEWLKENGAKIS